MRCCVRSVYNVPIQSRSFVQQREDSLLSTTYLSAVYNKQLSYTEPISVSRIRRCRQNNKKNQLLQRVSLYAVYMCPDTALYMCPLIALYMCPHTASYMCPHTALQMCPDTALYICVLILLYICVLIQLHICVLIHTALYMCPHTALYVSSYCSIYVSSCFSICRWQFLGLIRGACTCTAAASLEYPTQSTTPTHPRPHVYSRRCQP